MDFGDCLGPAEGKVFHIETDPWTLTRQKACAYVVANTSTYTYDLPQLAKLGQERIP